ncbi:hypothetical protein T440DRAFT_224252 [Plenodomus tracheiphilus IPT5]|uniref:PH domain-containing protein n=1 Tax=Plenodomus tracheiphilus IPT5 TaxID=1408161 RepID=A0A6A7AW70_9PLEO|nr:hypothetical protein T440DRAFT_224252 [Plenodomus tracheiphilus IPT5]
MAAVSAQIHTPSIKTPSEEKSRLRPGSSLRSRTQDTPTGSRWRFTRSTTNLREAASRSGSTSSSQVPPPPVPKPERPASKMSIFSLFSRPKVERARGHTEVGLAVPMRPQTPPKPAPPTSTPKSSLRQNPSPPAQQSIRSRSSQMFRPTSMRPTMLHREFGDWEPPPLFQAFPQSLKHATVQACVFPPEVLMRSQSQRRHAEIVREKMDSVRDLSTIAENGSESKKLEKNHKRLMSNSVLNPTMPELVNKIYILVAAGYVLQYAGDGTFDRTPEKVLKLGKESAAFACDLIPGKHWVLQISSHAHDDGTFETGPKNSLLSRLRTQNATTKAAATSFLLVLESAEEMDAWMSAIRKEIDNLGGMKAKEESMRASSSTDDSAGKISAEAISHRYQVQRDPETISKVTPWETPLASQRSDSPRIVTSDWATNASERSVSVADSIGGQSSRVGNGRQSVEMSSVASTPISQHQVQLDGLRGRSRFSFMSTGTSTSGPGTRNTSRDSSPAPTSPLKEVFLPGDGEPLRSAMSLKSFHMNPNNSSASRRRSMQPLPITNEIFPQVVTTPIKQQRHSLYSPTSPKAPELGEQSGAGPKVPAKDPEVASVHSQSRNIVPHIADAARSSPVQSSAVLCPGEPVATREDSPVRVDNRTYNVPPRRDVISPPPREPAPLPPQPARRQSSIGVSPSFSSQPMAMFSSGISEARIQRRISATPKPFMRPLPVRPQAQHADGSMIVPRRQSSLAPTSAPAPLPFGINVNRSVTAPVRPPSAAANMTPTSSPGTHHPSLPPSQTLRRPTSVQIRSDPAPFLSSARPARAISSTPSFVPGRRSSNAQAFAPTTRVLQAAPSIDTLRQQALAQQTQPKIVTPRRSMPVMGLPPPAPPPNMPLPTLPPNMPLPPTPSNSSTPTPPPNMPLPSPPPSMPLPPTPPTLLLPTPPPSVPLPPTPPEVQATAKGLAV